MRILVLADIHANWPALAAIQEPFDACLVLGDLVDYGTDPVPCVEWVWKHATCAIRGNHDHGVAQHVPARPGGGLKSLAAATRPFQWKFLDRQMLKYLSRLPVTQRFRLDNKDFFLVHATPRDPLDEYLLDDKAAWAARLHGEEAEIVCVGHTHIPFLIEVNGMQILNPGSVGQPRDGDSRAAYAIIDDGRIELKRVEYDIEETLAQMRSVGLDEESLRMAEAMLKTGGRPQLFEPN